jgi:hypothetical protein
VSDLLDESPKVVARLSANKIKRASVGARLFGTPIQAKSGLMANQRSLSSFRFRENKG